MKSNPAEIVKLFIVFEHKLGFLIYFDICVNWFLLRILKHRDQQHILAIYVGRATAKIVSKVIRYKASKSVV